MTQTQLRSPLWFMDGARYGRVEARLMADGGLEIRSHEMGAGERDVWGEDDAEATLRIAPADVARFALALVSGEYADRADAFNAIRALCETHDVPAAFAVWT